MGGHKKPIVHPSYEEVLETYLEGTRNQSNTQHMGGH